ncbi:hypothetical protein [Seonamhaeicola maritimus]|uniref:hypothetical protein n=1 Tax=Seonamhaeicola maritimus TaxID=2591822 RepID=UPI002495181E|nr:hypothetical protein [Seonamhaeicola maritimus]
MKLKEFIIPIIVFLVGLILTYLGALLKIIHFEIGFLTSNILLAIATFIKVVAVILVMIKLIIIYKNK